MIKKMFEQWTYHQNKLITEYRAKNTAIAKVCQESNESECLTCLRYINIQEYWPASGRYDKNTVMHIRRTIGS